MTAKSQGNEIAQSLIKFQPKFSVAGSRVKNQELDWGLFRNADVLDDSKFQELGFKNQGLDDTFLKYFFWSLLVIHTFILIGICFRVSQQLPLSLEQQQDSSRYTSLNLAPEVENFNWWSEKGS